MRHVPFPVPFPTPTGAATAAHSVAAGLDWASFNQIYLAVAAVSTGLLVAYFNARYQARKDNTTGVQASRAEVTTNYGMAMTYMRETVEEVRAQAQAAQAAEAASEQRLRELRVAFRAFGEEALSKAPQATWSSQAMDTLFNLGLSIASVERAHDRASNHVDRIAEKATQAEHAVSAVEQAAQNGVPPQEQPGPSGQPPDGGKEPLHGDGDTRVDAY